MSTFLELKNLVYTAIARDSTDAAAALIVPVAVNTAIKAVGIAFNPPILNTTMNISVPSGNDYFALTGYHITDVIDLYNVTESIHMKFIPYENFKTLVPTVAATKFYSVLGEWLYFNRAVPTDTTITVKYLYAQPDLENDDDDIHWHDHDGLIVSVASAFAFAAFEEGDAVNVWSTVASMLGVSHLQATRMREIVAGKPVLMESPITGALAGSK